MTLLSRISLVAMLIVASIFELVLNRLGLQLFGRRFADSWVLQWINVGGIFFYYLTYFLALGIFAWATVIVIRKGKYWTMSFRTAFTIASALFLPLAAVGIFGLPPMVVPYLNISFVFILVVMVAAFMRHRAFLRTKLAVFHLALPLLFHGSWLATLQVPFLVSKVGSAVWASKLFEIGEDLVVVSAFAVFLFLVPFPRRVNLFEPLPFSISLVVTGLTATLLSINYPDAEAIGYYGFGINMPPLEGEGAITLAALFFFLLTVGILVRRPGIYRGKAAGLVLVAISGFQLNEAPLFLLTLTGILLLIRAATTEEQQKNSSFEEVLQQEALESFADRFVKTNSHPIETGNFVSVSNDKMQITRMHGKNEDIDFLIRILSEGNKIHELEIVVGSLPQDVPSSTIIRKRSAMGSFVKSDCGPKIFKHGPFVVYGRNNFVKEILMDQDIFGYMEKNIHGSLHLWPKEGLCYKVKPFSDGWPIPVAEIIFSAQDACIEDLSELLLVCHKVFKRIS